MREETPALIKAILAAIVGTALADHQIQKEERLVLRSIIEQYGLEEGEMIAALDEQPRPAMPDSGPDALLERTQIMRYALLAAQADGKIDRNEVGYLKDLGARLGLEEAEWKDLEELSTQIHRATRGGAVNATNLREILEKYLG